MFIRVERKKIVARYAITVNLIKYPEADDRIIRGTDRIHRAPISVSLSRSEILVGGFSHRPTSRNTAVLYRSLIQLSVCRNIVSYRVCLFRGKTERRTPSANENGMLMSSTTLAWNAGSLSIIRRRTAACSP